MLTCPNLRFYIGLTQLLHTLANTTESRPLYRSYSTAPNYMRRARLHRNPPAIAGRDKVTAWPNFGIGPKRRKTLPLKAKCLGKCTRSVSWWVYAEYGRYTFVSVLIYDVGHHYMSALRTKVLVECWASSSNNKGHPAALCYPSNELHNLHLISTKLPSTHRNTLSWWIISGHVWSVFQRHRCAVVLRSSCDANFTAMSAVHVSLRPVHRTGTSALHQPGPPGGLLAQDTVWRDVCATQRFVYIKTNNKMLSPSVISHSIHMYTLFHIHL